MSVEKKLKWQNGNTIRAASEFLSASMLQRFTRDRLRKAVRAEFKEPNPKV